MLCACGCNRTTKRAQRTDVARGVKRGDYQRFIAGHNARRGRDGRCRYGHVLANVGLDTRGGCAQCGRLRTAAWHAAHPEYAAARNRRKRFAKYGMTQAEYVAMLERQNCLCALCRKPPLPRKHVTTFHVDHDHVSGRVRGLLCYHCNWSLGKFNDSPELLRQAADYLERLSE